MELHEKYLERDGIKIYYWLGGKNDAPLVVFTHGATVDHHEWDSTLPIVTGHFKVLAWDVRGHGKSRPARLSIKEALNDLIAILDELHVDQVYFVGHSMGGNLHQELVFNFPERVKGMVFLDCTWNFQKLTALESFSLSIAGTILKIYPYSVLINESLSATATTIESQELLRPAMESLSKAEFVQILLETSSCLHYEPDYKIGKPLLLIVGDEDKTGNIRKVMPIWAQNEPDCRFVVIPNAKHAANLDNPELFNKEVLEFLLSIDNRKSRAV
jgi:3-oxoadipate enol-lactonase